MKISRRLQNISSIVCGFVIIGSILSTQASATTYYLSPTGSDSNSGTFLASPWKTFAFAISKLQAGDTLILRNGTYNGSNSGYLRITCGTNAKNGTDSARITVKAENERQAFISGNGLALPFGVTGCSYWTFEGLRVRNADNSGTTNPVAGGVVEFRDCSNITARRMLASHNNRYVNASIFRLIQTTDSLVEENEIYSYHRNGFVLSSNSTGNTVRRNYANSRDHADIEGGYPSNYASKGDGGFTCYPCSNNLFENNIAENVGNAISIQASGTATDNLWLGHISLSSSMGAILRSRANTLDRMPQRNTFKNFVAVNISSVGFYQRSAKDTRCENCTLIDGSSYGFLANPESSPYLGDGNPSVYMINTLSATNNGYGFRILNHSTWAFDYSHVYSNGTDYSPNNTNAKITNEYTPLNTDPNLGSCKVFIPSGSPMKGAGKDGRDIGANVLYRYENGILTDKPLWNPASGQFPCGAIVAGVNDVKGSSCFDVHQRLNVNTNGCYFPSDYQQILALAPPANLRIISK